MLAISITGKGQRIISGLGDVADLDTPQMRRQMGKVGALVEGVARDYTPISPTLEQYKSTLKNPKKSKAKGKNFTPGSLRKSLTHDVLSATEVDVYTASNAGVSEYAAKIHDEKGQSWRFRGPGTEAAGAQADHKYIKRAIDDNEENIATLIVNGVIESIEGI